METLNKTNKKAKPKPHEETESPGSPMGKFQGHNINEYGPDGCKGKIGKNKKCDVPERE